MSAFNPIPAPKLIEQLEPEAAGVDVRVIIADLAEAGLIKSYARLVSSDRAPEPTEVRDSTVGRDTWRRINAEGLADDVWSTGTARLSGDNGGPQISVIGIRFEVHAVRSALVRHGIPLRKSSPTIPQAALTAPTAATSPATSAAAPAAGSSKQLPSLTEAVNLSIDDAARLLRIGRTTVYERIKDGTLVARKLGRRTHIDADCVRRLVGQGQI